MPPSFSTIAVRLAVLLPPVLLAGCADVPAMPPQAAAADARVVAASTSLAGTDAGEWPAGEWWTQLGDPQLDTLIAEGLRSAPDMASAQARYRSAAATLTEARAGSLPRLDANGTAGYEKMSLNNGYPAEFVALLPQGWNDNGQVTANLGYDFDLWGKTRAKLAAATSQARAAALDVAQARLLLSSAIASAYVDLGLLIAARDVRARILETRRAEQALMAQREENGLETRGSLRGGDAGLEQARGDLAAAEEAVALRRHALAALVGAGPDRGLAITPPALGPVAQGAGLPAGATTALLGRRPDIAAARARMEAAAARIRAARADFFPAVSLSALVGVQSLGLSQLFQSNSTFGTVGPAISLPVFHGGELRGRYRGARADFDAAVADYDRTVVAAYQQVADAVTTRAALARQLADARAALAAARDAHAIAERRFAGGLFTRLDVLAAADREAQAELSQAALEAASRDADVALIRALGGGFTAPDAAAIPPTNPPGNDTHG